MAKPPIGKPYVRWGKWVIRDPELRTLNAKNEKEAIKEAERTKPKKPSTGFKVVEPTTAKHKEIKFDDGPSDTNPLDAWIASRQSEDLSSTDTGSDDISQIEAEENSDPVVSNVSARPSDTVSASEPNASNLTITKAEKDHFHSLLSGIVTRANVITVGYSIKLFGRAPAEPSPDDTALLEKAWQAQLAIWFGNAEIAPWTLILAASVGMGLGMWAGGEPLPPKPPKGGKPVLAVVPPAANDNGKA